MMPTRSFFTLTYEPAEAGPHDLTKPAPTTWLKRVHEPAEAGRPQTQSTADPRTPLHNVGAGFSRLGGTNSSRDGVPFYGAIDRRCGAPRRVRDAARRRADA